MRVCVLFKMSIMHHESATNNPIKCGQNHKHPFLCVVSWMKTVQRWWLLYPNQRREYAASFFPSFPIWLSLWMVFKALKSVCIFLYGSEKSNKIHKFQTCQSICTEWLALMIIINERMVDLMVFSVAFGSSASPIRNVSTNFYYSLVTNFYWSLFGVGFENIAREREAIVSFYLFVTKFRRVFFRFHSLD